MSGRPEASDTTAYPKIPGPLWRDPATNQLTDTWSSGELAATKDLRWQWTEKVDGTNIRVIWDGHRVSFAGRTLRAQLPVPLFVWLQERFGGPEREQLFEQKFGAGHAVLYGEGFGPGIQNGGKYRPDVAVAFYDVLVDDRWWLRWADRDEVLGYFGTPIVPSAGVRSLAEQVAAVRSKTWMSSYGQFPVEGFVGTTLAGLRGRDGQRLIVKVKTRDFHPTETEEAR